MKFVLRLLIILLFVILAADLLAGENFCSWAEVSKIQEKKCNLDFFDLIYNLPSDKKARPDWELEQKTKAARILFNSHAKERTGYARHWPRSVKAILIELKAYLPLYADFKVGNKDNVGSDEEMAKLIQATSGKPAFAYILAIVNDPRPENVQTAFDPSSS